MAALGVDGESRTTDNGGFGYDIDFYFYDGEGAYMADTACVVVGEDEYDCPVPAGAATVEVVAWIGFDLEVTVLDKTPPPPEEEEPPTTP